MGGIHPRFKHEVGRRLALAYRGTLTPTIASCSVKPSSGSIELAMTVAEDDHLLVPALGNGLSGSNTQDGRLILSERTASNVHPMEQVQWSAEDFEMSGWGVKDSSSLMVCLPKKGQAAAQKTTADDCLTDADLWVSAPLVATGVVQNSSHARQQHVQEGTMQPPPATQQTLSIDLGTTKTVSRFHLLSKQFFEYFTKTASGQA